MAFWQGNLQTATVGGEVYVGNPTNGLLYATTNVMGQLVVTRPAAVGSYTNAAGAATYEWGVATNAVLVHSAVYDFFGYDPTTALPSQGAGTNAVAGANTVPFTRLWKKITDECYLVDGDALKGKLASEKTDSNGNLLPDGYELYLSYVPAESKADASIAYTDAVALGSARGHYDPYDGNWFYKQAQADGTLPALVAPYDNGFAVSRRAT